MLPEELVEASRKQPNRFREQPATIRCVSVSRGELGQTSWQVLVYSLVTLVTLATLASSCLVLPRLSRLSRVSQGQVPTFNPHFTQPILSRIVLPDFLSSGNRLLHADSTTPRSLKNNLICRLMGGALRAFSRFRVRIHTLCDRPANRPVIPPHMDATVSTYR
jgi:hypothetical protein